MIDAKTFGAEISAMVRGYVDKSLAPLQKENEALRTRNEALEARLKAVEDRPAPQSPDLTGIERTVEELRAVVDAIELPETPELPDIPGMIEAYADEVISEKIAAIPVPKNGKDADPAELEAVRKDIAVLTERLANIKTPEVVHGKDGAAVVSAKVNDDGELICKLTNGETLNAGRVRGSDGLGFDDLTLEHDGERGFVLRFVRGDEIKEFPVSFAVPLDRGVYKEDGQYQKGDAVTWAGSLWIAQKDAPEGKPEQSKDWRLAVKRGRDGKPAVKP